jgi:hypothetical protein
MAIMTKGGQMLTDKMIEALGEACERGEYPGVPTGEIIIGRPRLFGEQLKPVTFKETEGKIAAIDKRAASLALSRSDYLRYLVNEDLASA